MNFFLRSSAVVLFSLLCNSSGAQEKLSLQNAIDLALQQNPQLILAHQQIAAARGRSLQSAALPPTGFFARVNEISFDLREQGEFEIGVSQSFEFPGKRGGRKALAQADWQIAELRLRRIHSRLRSEVKRRYFENLLAKENVSTQQFTVQILQDLQQLLADRYRDGSASYVEIVRSRVELGQGRSELADARQKQTTALASLNLLLGREIGSPVEFSDTLFYTPLPLPRDSLFAQVLRQSTLRQILTAGIERQHRALQLARINGRPDFSLGAAFQRVAENPPFTAAQPNGETVNAFSVEARIDLPLFNRAAPKGEQQIARTELAIAETQLKYFTHQLGSNFEMAFARATAAEQQLLEFRDVIVPESQNAIEAALVAYQSDQLALTDLLDVYRTAGRARLEFSQAVFNYLTAGVDLETVGEIFEPGFLQE